MKDFFDHATVAVMCWSGAVLMHGWGVNRPIETFMNFMAILMAALGVFVLVEAGVNAIVSTAMQNRKVHKRPKHTVK